MGWMLLMMALGALLGMVLLRLRVPGGLLLGAIVAAAAVHTLTGEGEAYPAVRVLAQAITGGYIGAGVSRAELRRMPTLIAPFLLVMTCFFTLNVAAGVFMSRVGGIDLLTALLSTAPGGVTDMPLLALDMGGDASVVAMVQFVRMIFGLTGIPAIVAIADRLARHGARANPDAAAPPQRDAPLQDAHTPVPPRRWLCTLAAALVAGGLGRLSGVPAGAMAGAMFGAVLFNLTGRGGRLPQQLRRVAQVMAGICIGATVEVGQFARLHTLLVPVLALLAGYMVLCLGVGYAVSRLFKFEVREGMLCLAPAGVTEMALIAEDMGVQSANIVVIQLGRLMSVVSLFPQLFRVVLHLLG